MRYKLECGSIDTIKSLGYGAREHARAKRVPRQVRAMLDGAGAGSEVEWNPKTKTATWIPFYEWWAS
jgi:hypothetical protein